MYPRFNHPPHLRNSMKLYGVTYWATNWCDDTVKKEFKCWATDKEQAVQKAKKNDTRFGEAMRIDTLRS